MMNVAAKEQVNSVVGVEVDKSAVPYREAGEPIVFAYENYGGGALAAVLDMVPLGIVLTDVDGRLRQANRTAREIAARGDGFLFRQGSVAAYRTHDSRRLLEAVYNAALSANDGSGVFPAAVSLARANGAAAYPVVISAVWDNPCNPGQPLAALFITDPDRPREAPAELIQRLYGLTAAEAAVTELLVAGQSLPEVAASQGVSHNTARTHLKHIFEKTGTARQAELVKKIMDTPVWIAARQTDEAWRRLQQEGDG